MESSYNKLWKLLEKRVMDIKHLMSFVTLAKLGVYVIVCMRVLAKICETIKCDI